MTTLIPLVSTMALATFFALATVGLSANETWITMHGFAKRLKESTRCIDLAHGDRRALCDCCLIQETKVHLYREMDAIARCQQAHQCLFDQTAGETKNAEHRLSMMQVIDVDHLSYPPELPPDGVLTNSDVENIMFSLANAGHLPFPSSFFATKSSTRPLVVKPLGDDSKGVFSGQLFFIGYSNMGDDGDLSAPKIHPLYILKETKKGISEIEHLYKMDVSPLKQERINSFDRHALGVQPSSTTIAQIAFDDVHFKLTTNKSERYFSLLQTAPGKSVNKHLRAFGKIMSDPATDHQVLKTELYRMHDIFYKIGFALSQLHQKYAEQDSDNAPLLRRTLTHGDLHSENIFYDDESGLVTLIDNETFALSLKRDSLGIDDIVEFYILHTVRTIAHIVAPQLTLNSEFGISDDMWHELWASLFDGYLAAFHPQTAAEFDSLFNDFHHQFYKGLSQRLLFRSPHLVIDQRKLKRFGPTPRLKHIKHNELEAAFTTLYEQNMKRFE